MTPEPAIEVRDLWKTFPGAKAPVFEGLSLEVPRERTTFLLGPSGTGKSVLLKHIVGLLRPDRGEVRVDGDPLPYGSLSRLNEVRKKFGVLFQNAALFDTMTVYQNVLFPLKAHRRGRAAEHRERVRSVLRAVGLDPEQTEGKLPGQLSGGMQKRVGLARAIILQPRIVLYDEPTSGLDPVNRSTVEDMIQDAKANLGLTNLVISHDIEAALLLADRIAFLHSGRIVFNGSPAEFEACRDPVIRSFLEAEKRHRRTA